MYDAIGTLPLFRRADPPTSKAAAERVSEFAGEHHRLILQALGEGPAHKDDIASRCGLTEQQVVRRLRAMERAGLVERTNETRPTASGRQATVWRAKDGR